MTQKMLTTLIFSNTAFSTLQYNQLCGTNVHSWTEIMIDDTKKFNSFYEYDSPRIAGGFIYYLQNLNNGIYYLFVLYYIK